jgi:prepilin-type N-terminal cleavage/methylation domain-containing protein
MKYKKGFTIIELLVSISILLLVSGAVVTIFISVISGQKSILSGQELSGQLSYALEYMSKALRMAGKDLTGDCLGSPGYNYLLTRYDSLQGVYKGVKFVDQSDNNICEEFFLDDSNSKTVIKDVKGTNSPVALTSDKIEIDSFKFIINADSQSQVSHSSENDKIQPRLTISLNASFWGEKNPPLKIQTTVSQRNLNIK